jgi:hypothetical protein
LCTPLRWKRERLKTPIFPQDEGGADPALERLSHALKFKHCLNHLVLAAGFKETLTSYCFRRGRANVVDRKLSRGRARRRRSC